VIIGIVLLQIVDDGKTNVPAAAKSTTTTTARTTSTTKKPTTTTTKQPTTPVKQPSQVPIVVVNAGAKPGSARTMSTALKGKGYTNQPNQPTDWSAKRSGNAVLCKTGFQREGVALAMAVGAGTQTAAFPTTSPPPSSGNVDCVVAIGS